MPRRTVRKLTACYRLHVGAEVRPAVLSWYAEPASVTTNDADLRVEAAHRRLLAPFTHLTARTADDCTVLLVAPFDPQLPQPIRLYDVAYVATMLGELNSEQTSRPAPASVQTVRYRPGQRHVLAVSAAADGTAAFIKIDRDDCGARAVRFAETVGLRLIEHCPTTRLVPPLGYSEPDHASVWRRVPGRSMTEELREPARGVELLERLERMPEGFPRLSHSDLKCDNILAEGERIWLLDLDRAGWADPALDVAKLLADLRWWGDHHSVGAPPLVRGFLHGYGPCDPPRLARAGLIAVVYQLRMAARRIPVHTLDWEYQVTHHVDAAAASLRLELAA